MKEKMVTQQKKKRPICEVLKKLLKKFDILGGGMDDAHNYANERIPFRNLFGTVLTIIYIGVLLNYLVYKYDSMLRFNDTNITQSMQEHFFPDNFKVKGAKEGF